MKKSIFLILLISSITFLNCNRKYDKIPEEIRLNDFVWGGMNTYYKWQSDVPELADDKFKNREQLHSYLAGFSSPESLFKSLRYKYGEVDRFSWMGDDYRVLENYFEGKSLSSGINFSVKEYRNIPGKAYAYITSVIPNSDAANKGVTRGMIFNKVNNVQLQVDTNGNLSNANKKALYGGAPFSITLATLSSGDAVDGTQTYDLDLTEISENPVQVVKTFDKGSKKIGYLLFNQFSASYDSELNSAFRTFKDDGINELVIDLRYNGGGSIRTAIYLASMISGLPTNDIFAKEIWNEKVMKAIDNKRFINYFSDEIKHDGINEAINSVNMSKVYFIVSDKTASASELVINGLKPYITVVLVGTKTVGKQVGSITLYDSDSYTKNGDNFNKNHYYYMQPIVFEITNKNGENEPNGYTPNHELVEDPSNMASLGDETEPLLAKVLELITTSGRSSGRRAVNQNISKDVFNNKMFYPNYQRMYIDNLK